MLALGLAVGYASCLAKTEGSGCGQQLMEVGNATGLSIHDMQGGRYCPKAG